MNRMRKMYDCPLCEQSFPVGDGLYGHRLHLYGDLYVCPSCWKNNADGWAPHYAEKLESHMKRQGLPLPAVNEDGFLPRGD